MGVRSDWRMFWSANRCPLRRNMRCLKVLDRGAREGQGEPPRPCHCGRRRNSGHREPQVERDCVASPAMTTSGDMALEEAAMQSIGSFLSRQILVSFVAGAIVVGAAPVRAESDLARAYRIIAGKQYVDLTHSFGPDSPVWSGFGQAKFTPAFDPKDKRPYTIAEDGFRTTYYDMVGQYGTHVDPPAHFDEKGITIDEIPLKQMILPLVVLDDKPFLAKDPHQALTD